MTDGMSVNLSLTVDLSTRWTWVHCLNGNSGDDDDEDDDDDDDEEDDDEDL